jgi:hypothetical protein
MPCLRCAESQAERGHEEVAGEAEEMIRFRPEGGRVPAGCRYSTRDNVGCVSRRACWRYTSAVIEGDKITRIDPFDLWMEPFLEEAEVTWMMKFTKPELVDLLMAVRCWLSEYSGASSDEEYERLEALETLFSQAISAMNEWIEEKERTP